MTDPAGDALAYVDLETLAPLPANPRGGHRLAALAASMRRYGFGEPLTVNAFTRHIVAGCGRWRSLRRMRDAGEDPPAGIRVTSPRRWLAPVLFGDWPEAEEPAVALALNGGPEGAMLGDWSRDVVAVILAGAPAVDLAALGVTEAKAAAIVRDAVPPSAIPPLDLAGIERVAPLELITVKMQVPRELADRLQRATRAGKVAGDILAAGLDACRAN